MFLEISTYNRSMEQREVATMFKALGDPTRLRILEFLRGCCCAVSIDQQGGVRPTAGEVCCSVTGSEKINSTISFHLKELRNAGLIHMEKQGKNMVCSVNQEAMRRLSEFLAPNPSSDCC